METNEQKQQYLNELMERFEKSPQSVDPMHVLLLRRFNESRQLANQMATRLDQLQKDLETGKQQLQQEVGKGAGYLDAILTLRPEERPVAPDVPPVPLNRKARRARGQKVLPS